MSSLSLNLNRVIFKDCDKNIMNQNIINLIKCKICLNVLTDPYDCLCCNQTFCFTCINNYILKTKKCPYDQSEKIERSGNGERESIIINNGIPTQAISSKEDDVVSIFTKLKPSSVNISNFLNTLKFHCINRHLGCTEEINYNNIIIHEMGCQFSQPPQQSQTSIVHQNPIRESLCNLSQSSNPLLERQRKISVMSFSTKIDQIYLENQQSILALENHTAQNEKLDKILDYLQYIQFSINNKNLFSTPTKEFNSETPKFSLSFTGKTEGNLNFYPQTGEDKIPHLNTPMTLNLQQEKIISEVEYLSDKISCLENILEQKGNFLTNEKLIKKLFEEQFNNLTEKILKEREGVSGGSNSGKNLNTNVGVNYSTNPNSKNNSLYDSRVLKKSSSANKFELDSNSALKKIKLGDKLKFKEKEKINSNGGTNSVNFNNNNLSTPVKSPSNQNSNLSNVSNFSHSPRFVAKTLFKDKEHKDSLKDTQIKDREGTKTKRESHGYGLSPMNSPLNNNSTSNKFDKNKKEFLEELQNANTSLTLKFEEKFDTLETNLIDLYSDNIDELKKHIDQKLVEEIKTMFIEVTLDSTNLFVQKFDEFINKLSLPVNTI
jgi:hypothetical protein